MSKAAFLFLGAVFVCGFIVLLAPASEAWNAIGKIGLALFSVLLFGALLVGRRIKFDPVLR
ncbi:PA3371 family protein [Stutzerimonas tarimensis]|uniref:PA3371 family protein n=1 Tax=Stutzerimonas tarimensis TaxID=1507735 RepID=A0ABV7T0A0_9GAMM